MSSSSHVDPSTATNTRPRLAGSSTRACAGARRPAPTPWVDPGPSYGRPARPRSGRPGLNWPQRVVAGLPGPSRCRPGAPVDQRSPARRRYRVCPAIESVDLGRVVQPQVPADLGHLEPVRRHQPERCSPVAWSVLEKTTRSPGRNPTGCATSSTDRRARRFAAVGGRADQDGLAVLRPRPTRTGWSRRSGRTRAPALTLLTTSKSLVSSTIWLPVACVVAAPEGQPSVGAVRRDRVYASGRSKPLRRHDQLLLVEEV